MNFFIRLSLILSGSCGIATAHEGSLSWIHSHNAIPVLLVIFVIILLATVIESIKKRIN